MREKTGMGENEVKSEIERYIVAPGQACAYKIGMLKIQESRARAQKELGDKFDQREFHDAVLKNGALPLEILEEQVEDYIQRKKASASRTAEQFHARSVSFAPVHIRRAKIPRRDIVGQLTPFCPKAFLEGSIYMHQGNEAKARTEFEHARVVSQQLLREALDGADRHAKHGLILAALGRKKEAVAEGKRAVELLPESQDAFNGPQVTASLAQIYAWTGEFDEAFRLLDHLLTIPSALNVPMLKLDPVWDPLRSDPAFQKLCEEKQP
jgi:tetratricopeptide (TPR) repeat protein